MVQPTRPGRPRRTVLLFDDILPSSTGIKSSDSLSAKVLLTYVK